MKTQPMPFEHLKSSRRDFLERANQFARIAQFTFTTQALGLSSSRLFPYAFASRPAAHRLFMIYYPNGAVLQKWHPKNLSTGIQSQPFKSGQSLSFALDPLSSLSENLLAFRGLNTLGHGGSSSHPEAASQILSGGARGLPSIEVQIAEALAASNQGPTTPLRYAHLGLFTRYNKGKDYLVFRDQHGRAILPEDDPTKAARLLFGDSAITPLNGSDARERTQTSAREAPGAASGTERRLRSLRQIEQDLEELLQGPACCSDRAQSRELTRKILAHQESVRTSINRLENNTPDGPNCGPQNQPMLSNEMRADNEIAEEILDAQWNNMIGACTCDITRVFGFSFMSAQDDSLYINFQSIKDLLDSSDGGGFGGEKKWWNQNQSHSSSHEANEVFAVQNRWYNLMVANLCQKLKATPDPLGGGSLFDTSLICMFSENGESANHGQEDVAWYLLGGANGLINGGRVLHCDGRGTSDLLLEIARIMGLDWNTYGRSSGGLPGLKA